MTLCLVRMEINMDSKRRRKTFCVCVCNLHSGCVVRANYYGVSLRIPLPYVLINESIPCKFSSLKAMVCWTKGKV